MKSSNSKVQETSDIQIKIFGYCEFDQEFLKEMFDSGKYNSIQEAKGEFTIVYISPREVQVITSNIGAMHYFYYFDGERFSHGQHVVDIVQEMKLNWKWDWISVGDLCELENLTENRTMHRDIKRIPPGTILRFNGRLTLWSTTLIDTIKETDANAVDAVDIFNDETSRWGSNNPYLSLSGGFDSRVILSAMLRKKIYPTLVTLGDNRSTDIQVAGKIANRFALDHKIVQLSLDDFFREGEHISYITNGSKSACHWHTYLYPQKVEVPKDQSFFVGTLGEFARCYYFDKGVLSILLDSFSGLAQEKFWELKLKRHRTFRTSEYSLLSDDLKEELEEESIMMRARRNARLSKGNLLSGGCRYYLEQRVPNFYANGIRMYNSSTQWRSPFHSNEWLKTIWCLSDNWKLGSNWHRLAINRNFPELLNFPEEKGLNRKRMLKKAPPLYWTPQVQRMKYQTYDLSESWYASNSIREYLMDNVTLIDDIAHKNLCDSILMEHKESKTRTRAISFLLTMLYFKRVISNRIK
jgi:asparagine synthase (glutamine-hydrolysing)